MKIVDQETSADGSKFLWQLDDGNTIESVYFTSINSSKQACISSQIGCNVGCGFCETGKQRSLRNLTTAEIVDQLRQTLSVMKLQAPLDTVSFAGMGEPLHNVEGVTGAAAVIRQERLAKQIVCFTSGVAPKIPMVADMEVDTLFVSLHATTNEVREKLIPTNHKYPIESIIEACHRYHERAQKRVWVNYLLLRDLNDSEEDADRLWALLDAKRFAV